MILLILTLFQNLNISSVFWFFDKAELDSTCRFLADHNVYIKSKINKTNSSRQTTIDTKINLIKYIVFKVQKTWLVYNNCLHMNHMIIQRIRSHECQPQILVFHDKDFFYATLSNAVNWVYLQSTSDIGFWGSN